MRRIEQTVYETDEGRQLLVIENDGTIKVIPATVTPQELCELGDAILHARNHWPVDIMEMKTRVVSEDHEEEHDDDF